MDKEINPCGEGDDLKSAATRIHKPVEEPQERQLEVNRIIWGGSFRGRSL